MKHKKKQMTNQKTKTKTINERRKKMTNRKIKNKTTDEAKVETKHEIKEEKKPKRLTKQKIE